MHPWFYPQSFLFFPKFLHWKDDKFIIWKKKCYFEKYLKKTTQSCPIRVDKSKVQKREHIGLEKLLFNHRMAKTILWKIKSREEHSMAFNIDSYQSYTHTHTFSSTSNILWDIQSRLVYHNRICSLNIYCKMIHEAEGRKKLKPIRTWISPLIKRKA